MAFQEHLLNQMAFQPFSDDPHTHSQSSQSRDMQMQRLRPLNMNNSINLRQQDFLHLQNDHVQDMSNKSSNRGGDRNRTESSSESEDLMSAYKADILAHPLYEQLLAAHVSCLRIATPVDQLPRIDGQLAQSQRVVDKYSSVVGSGVVDDKELDHFMV